MVSQLFYNIKHPCQVSTTTALVSFAAESLMPLSVVEWESFHSFVIPSMKCLVRSIL